MGDRTYRILVVDSDTEFVDNFCTHTNNKSSPFLSAFPVRFEPFSLKGLTLQRHNRLVNAGADMYLFNDSSLSFDEIISYSQAILTQRPYVRIALYGESEKEFDKYKDELAVRSKDCAPLETVGCLPSAALLKEDEQWMLREFITRHPRKPLSVGFIGFGKFASPFLDTALLFPQVVSTAVIYSPYYRRHGLDTQIIKKDRKRVSFVGTLEELLIQDPDILLCTASAIPRGPERKAKKADRSDLFYKEYVLYTEIFGEILRSDFKGTVIPIANSNGELIELAGRMGIQRYRITAPGNIDAHRIMEPLEPILKAPAYRSLQPVAYKLVMGIHGLPRFVIPQSSFLPELKGMLWDFLKPFIRKQVTEVVRATYEEGNRELAASDQHNIVPTEAPRRAFELLEDISCYAETPRANPYCFHTLPISGSVLVPARFMYDSRGQQIVRDDELCERIGFNEIYGDRGKLGEFLRRQQHNVDKAIGAFGLGCHLPPVSY